MEFLNSYEDAKRAEAYAKLEFPGTYYLAYRDLPEIIFKHVKGRNAIDFGCGTGRSTRFLQKLIQRHRSRYIRGHDKKSNRDRF